MLVEFELLRPKLIFGDKILMEENVFWDITQFLEIVLRVNEEKLVQVRGHDLSDRIAEFNDRADLEVVIQEINLFAVGRGVVHDKYCLLFILTLFPLFFRGNNEEFGFACSGDFSQNNLSQLF